MFSMTKSRELDGLQTTFYFVNIRHYGENVKFYLFFQERIISLTKYIYLNYFNIKSLALKKTFYDSLGTNKFIIVFILTIR